MGRYLTIGIATKILINKEQARAQASATSEEVKKALQDTFNQSGIYDVNENESCVWLALKPTIAEPEWLEFLQDFYKLRYQDEMRGNMADLEIIKTRKTLKEWLELAKEKPYPAFQLDKNVDHNIPFPRGWTNTLRTNIEQIILSIDGKIIMECYDDVFSFFTCLIKERLSKYQLTNSLLVEISG